MLYSMIKSFKINVLIIIIIFSIPAILFGGGYSNNPKNLDLTTPEKTLGVFIQAFKTGDDNLLDFVLAKNASIPEFNALQVIKCPSPEMVRYEIKRFRVVTKKGQYARDSLPGDIEVYVLLIEDEALIGSDSSCNIRNAIPYKGVYLLRSFDGAWKIVSAAPFWPDEIKALMEKNK